MENLTKEELLNITGGNFIETAAFFAGYTAGRALDFVHGLVHGLSGTECE